MLILFVLYLTNLSITMCGFLQVYIVLHSQIYKETFTLLAISSWHIPDMFTAEQLWATGATNMLIEAAVRKVQSTI